jgi:hypothetical protein
MEKNPVSLQAARMPFTASDFSTLGPEPKFKSMEGISFIGLFLLWIRIPW